MLGLAPYAVGCGLFCDIRALAPPLSNKAISLGVGVVWGGKHLRHDKITFRSDNHIKAKAGLLCVTAAGIQGGGGTG